MDIVNYKDLKLKLKQETGTEIDINGVKVFVYDYCTTQDANEIIAITLQKSFENGIFNPIKVKRYFLLNYIYIMTNLHFEDEDREDELYLFNTLDTNEVFSKVVEASNDVFVELNEQLENVIQQNFKYGSSIGGAVNTAMKGLKEYSDQALKNLESFDVEEYQKALDMIKNGGSFNRGKMN